MYTSLQLAVLTTEGRTGGMAAAMTRYTQGAATTLTSPQRKVAMSGATPVVTAEFAPGTVVTVQGWTNAGFNGMTATVRTASGVVLYGVPEAALDTAALLRGAGR